MTENLEKTLTFSDVLIVPQYSEIKSRKDIDLSVSLKNFRFSLPVVSANMKTITESSMARQMHLSGGLGIIHRFNTIEENVEHYCIATKPIENKIPIAGVSIGVRDEDKPRFDRLYEAGAKIFCIDVAHGHSINVKDMLQWIESKNIEDVVVIAGNVATGDGAYDLADWGADVVKVGIGSGSKCTTRLMTGVGVPQLSAIKEVYGEFKAHGVDRKIISDGGIKTVGDICKSLKYADMVMVGGFVAGTAETPGNVFRNENQEFYKVYRGSASGENKVENGYSAEFIEGISSTVPFRGKVKHVLREIDNGIRSSFSYVGAKNMEEFKQKCEFKTMGDGGRVESKL